MQKLLLGAAAAALSLGASAASAQAPDWTGFYVGATVGMTDGRDKKGETIQFDTNLDGTYGDTVRTAAGADAFSPGFCGGSFNTNAAPGGCRSDDDSDTSWSLRLGYDRQILGNWVVGGVVEYSRVQFQDSVTAFSVTSTMRASPFSSRCDSRVMRSSLSPRSADLPTCSNRAK